MYKLPTVAVAHQGFGLALWRRSAWMGDAKLLASFARSSAPAASPASHASTWFGIFGV